MNRPKVTASDIRVLGLVQGTHVIEDLGRDVAYGVEVRIAARDAALSKDLWRGISTKCLFQIPQAAPPAFHYPEPPKAAPAPIVTTTAVQDPQLTSQVQNLTSQMRTLEEENKSLREAMKQNSDANAEKLDAILSAVQNGAFAAPAGNGATTAPKEEVADGSAPTFLPSQIRPTDMEARIDIQGTSADSTVSSARERLRQLKKGTR